MNDDPRNSCDPELEKALRQAPQPQPPLDLKERLLAAMRLPQTGPRKAPTLSPRTLGSWFRHWWPVLAPSAVLLVCAGVLTVQQANLRDLREAVRTLSQAVTPTPSKQADTGERKIAGAAGGATGGDQAEVARLKQQAAQLAAEIAPLEKLQEENTKLRAQLAAAPVPMTPELQADIKAMEQAKAKAQTIACVNNLKQLGLAVKLWANDHHDAFPTNILEMTNEMATPKILVCPADTNRVVAANWASFTPANCSYQYLGGDDQEPNRVMFICPIHGNVGLCDGSVQMGVAKTHPDWLVHRNGKVYLERH